MDLKRQFELDIYKLGNKKHRYEFEIDDQFFDMFEDSFLSKGKLHVSLELDKSETMIIADFVIKGNVELVCDRSLDEFNHEVFAERQLIFKFGEEFEEISDEIVIIPQNTQKLDVSQYIYEFIGLSIPMKKLHPRFCDEIFDETDDDKTESVLVFSTDSQEKSEPETEEEEKIADDVWEKLKKIKSNNN